MTYHANTEVLPVLPTCTAPLGWDTKFGWRIDGAITKWWPTKTSAVAGAKAIGWSARDLAQVHTRFQCGYALITGVNNGLVSKVAYEQILNGTFSADTTPAA